MRGTLTVGDRSELAGTRRRVRWVRHRRPRVRRRRPQPGSCTCSPGVSPASPLSLCLLWQSKHTCFPSPTACSQEPVSPAAHVHLHARSDSTCLVTCCVSLRQHPAVLSPSSSPSFCPPLKPRDSIPWMKRKHLSPCLRLCFLEDMANVVWKSKDKTLGELDY